MLSQLNTDDKTAEDSGIESGDEDTVFEEVVDKDAETSLTEEEIATNASDSQDGPGDGKISRHCKNIFFKLMKTAVKNR